jgi:hypothetical protein
MVVTATLTFSRFPNQPRRFHFVPLHFYFCYMDRLDV